MVKNLPAIAGDVKDMGLISGLEDPLEKTMAPILSSCLENPMDRGTCWAIAHRVAKNQI